VFFSVELLEAPLLFSERRCDQELFLVFFFFLPGARDDYPPSLRFTFGPPPSSLPTQNRERQNMVFFFFFGTREAPPRNQASPGNGSFLHPRQTGVSEGRVDLPGLPPSPFFFFRALQTAKARRLFSHQGASLPLPPFFRSFHAGSRSTTSLLFPPFFCSCSAKHHRTLFMEVFREE